MAIGSMFRRSSDSAADEERAVNEERAAAEDRARAQDAPTAAERADAADRAAAEERAAVRDRELAGDRRVVDDGADRVVVREPRDPRDRIVDAPDAVEPDVAETVVTEPAVHAHTSVSATISLILGLSGVYAALSGRLAPAALAIGVVGLLFAAVAMGVVSRRRVTGHHVAILGLILSLGAIVLGVMAINHAVPWLNGDADQAGQLRDWLNGQFPWLKSW